MIEVEMPDGVILEFPDGTDDGVIDNAAQGYISDWRAKNQAETDAAFNDTSNRSFGERVNRTVETVGRPLQIAGQSIGGAIGNLAGMPADLQAFGQDLVRMPLEAAGVADQEIIGGLKVGDFTSPNALSNAFTENLLGLEDGAINETLGSKNLRHQTGEVAAALGYDELEQDEMTRGERMAGRAIEFGAEALGTGGLLARGARAAAARGDDIAKIPAYLQAYLAAPKRALTVDAAAGAGAGAAFEAFDDNPWVQALASVGAGLGTGVAANAALRAPDTAHLIRRIFPDAEVSRQMGKKVSLGDVENLSRTWQKMAIDPEKAADRIGENMRTFDEAGAPYATAGAMSGDTGLLGTDKSLRQVGDNAAQNRLMENERLIKETSLNQVRSLENEGADFDAVKRMALDEEDRVVGGARRNLEAAETGLTAAQQRARDVAAEPAARSTQRALEQASASLDDALSTKGVMPTTRTKNELYDAIDPDGTVNVDAAPLTSAARGLRDELADPALAPLKESIPTALVKRIGNLADGQEVTAKSVMDLRKHLNRGISEAQRKGEFDLADSLRRLKMAGDETIDVLPEAEKAKAFNRDVFAPAARDNPVAEQYQRDLFAGSFNGSRGASPAPSRTADRFLTTPEGADGANAILRQSSAPQQGAEAIRNALTGQLGRASVRTGDDMIDPARAKAWQRDNDAVLDRFPDARNEVQTTIRNADDAAQAIEDSRRGIRDAKTGLTQAEKAFNQSIISKFGSEYDIRTVTKQILSTEGRKAKGQMAEIAQLVEADPVAREGLRSAVADALASKVHANMVETAGNSVKEFKPRLIRQVIREHDKALRQIFSNAEMKQIHRSGDIMRPLEDLAIKALNVGSDTYSNQKAKERLMNTLDASILTVTGNAVTAGMVMKRIKVGIQTAKPDFFDGDTRELKLMADMNENAPLVQNLLRRNVRDATPRLWNTPTTTLPVAGNTLHEAIAGRNEKDKP